MAKLAKEQIAPLVSKMDEDNQLDPSVIKTLFDNGLMGIETPVDYGGSGCNFMTSMLVVEELSKVDASVGAYVDIHNTLVNNLMLKVGNEEQKAKYLPILAQQASGSFALTEPTSGSDAFGLKTTAKQDGDHYVINGTKMWISNSGNDYIIFEDFICLIWYVKLLSKNFCFFFLSDVSQVFLVFANVDPSKV